MDRAGECSFNLIDQPWIPAIFLDGQVEDVSLLRALEEAHLIRGISGDIPQQAIVLHRLMLAVIYRSYSLTDGDWDRRKALDLWKEEWAAGSFDPDVVGAYLQEVHGRFDLFGDRPFFQVAGLAYDSKDKEFDSVTELMADVPKPKKFLFSMRAKDAPEAITFAQAARWLLFHQGFAISGNLTPVVGNSHVKDGKVFAPKGTSIGWLGAIGGVFAEGSSLFETLMLNWVMYDRGGMLFGRADDVPSWERDNFSADYAPYVPTGPISLFTVQSRRMRLVADVGEGMVVGAVSCYGDIVRPVGTSSIPSVPLMPKTHDSSRALWRGLGPLLARANAGERDCRPALIGWFEELCGRGVEPLPQALRVHDQGVEYGKSNSSIVDAYDDSIDLGGAILREDKLAVDQAVATVGNIDKAVQQFVHFARYSELVSDSRQFKREKQAKRRPSSADKRVSEDYREQAYLMLDKMARDRLRGFTDKVDAERYCREWRQDVRSRLLRLADKYVSDSDASRFEMRDGRSIEGELQRFRKSLKTVLDI